MNDTQDEDEENNIDDDDNDHFSQTNYIIELLNQSSLCFVFDTDCPPSPNLESDIPPPKVS